MLIAIGCLFALKTFGLFSDGGYTLGQRLGGGNTLVVTTVPTAPVAELRSPAVPLEVAGVQPQRSWMQEMFNYPGGDITGSVPAPKPRRSRRSQSRRSSRRPRAEGRPPATVIAQDQPRPASAGERALLERLQERRQELDARARELDLRESMLKAAEKKLETQTAVEARTGGGRRARLGQWPSARKRKRPRTPASRASSPCTRP